MDANRWEKIKEIYDRALDLSSEERDGFLAKACGDDADLCREVESLLAAHDDAGTFLQSPAVNFAAREIVADEDTSPATQLIGRELANYRIVSLLGRGGMGVVYLAEDKRLRRKVALKLLPAQFMNDAERVRRFKREAAAVSAINHPNILTIHEIGQIEQRHYLVTEYVAGETLRQRLTQGRVEVMAALEVGVQVASAMDAAHEAGIIHRDIKPENIMLRPDGLVKVLDFGLAKLTEPSRPGIDTQASTIVGASTETGVVMGTPRYMSPEQVRGVKMDGRTDIFSLGVVLYEMIAGRAPFAGATMADVIAAILEREPAPLAQYLPEAPRELERILRCALRKDCEQRYLMAKDLLRDLKSLKQELEFEAKRRPFAQPEAPSRVSSGREAIEPATAPGRALLSRQIVTRRWVLVVGALAFTLIAMLAGWRLGWFAGLSGLGAPELKQRQLTTNPIDDPVLRAAISPDGKYLAYTALAGIQVLEIDNGKTHLIKMPEDFCFR
jgi:serine/threonine protein kinase